MTRFAVRWPLVRRSTHERLEHRFDKVVDDRNQYRVWHWSRCGCHDAWDKCSCWSAGHPADGSCDCCDLGTGGCGPKPKAAGR